MISADGPTRYRPYQRVVVCDLCGVSRHFDSLSYHEIVYQQSELGFGYKGNMDANRGHFVELAEPDDELGIYDPDHEHWCCACWNKETRPPAPEPSLYVLMTWHDRVLAGNPLRANGRKLVKAGKPSGHWQWTDDTRCL